MKFIINGDKLKIEQAETINSGSFEDYLMPVEYDESWNDLIIEARIVEDKSSQGISRAVIDNQVYIDMSKKKRYAIGFIGYTIENNQKIHQKTTDLKIIPMIKGAGEIEVTNTEEIPTESEWEIYLAQVQEFINNGNEIINQANNLDLDITTDGEISTIIITRKDGTEKRAVVSGAVEGDLDHSKFQNLDYEHAGHIGFQATINDLNTIREGANAGATAVQPKDLGSLATKNIIDYDTDIANKPIIPEEVTESTISSWGFTKNTGTYSKPNGGIPKTDLTSSVQASLEKADSALQSHQDISIKEDKINKSDNFKTSSSITYASTKALVDGLETKQNKLTAGNNITIENDVISATGGSSGGTSNYNDLSNKPKINNVELSGNKSLSDLGIATKTSDLTNDSGFITKLVNDLSNYYLKSETYTKTEVNNLIGQIGSIQFQVVNELPLTGNSSYIYLVPSSNPTTQNIKDEYMWNNNAWEQIGSIRIDLTGYATENWVNSQISIFLTSTQIQNLINASLDGYVQDSNYVHTDNNYTSAEKTKLANLEEENEALYNDHPDITATGTNVTLNGTGDFKMKVDVSGNSTQIQYEGYNLLNIPNNEITLVKLTNRVVNISPIDTLTLEAGTYTIVFPDLVLTNNVENLGVQLVGLESLGSTLSNKKRTITLTEQATLKYLYCFLASSDNDNATAKFTKIMLYEGTTEKPYEPYVGNQASPNPTYKQDINNVEGDVEVTTKNSDNSKLNTVTFPLSQGQKLMLGDTLEDDGIHHKRAVTTFTGTTITLLDAKTDGAYLSNCKIGGILSGQTLTFDSEVTNATIEYELATETIEIYTEAQQIAYNKLKEMHSYYDLTYVIGTSDNAQPILTAQAKKSLKVMQNEINNIESRLSLLE